MTIIQRAFEIARIGTAATVHDIRKQLVREGFTHVQSHFNSTSLQKQLRALIKARGEARSQSS